MKTICKSHGIRMSIKGRYCLDDIVEKIIESKQPDVYMKKTKDKISINSRSYVTEQIAREILSNAKAKKAKDLLLMITNEENKDNPNNKLSIINPDEALFQYEGKKFTAIYIKKNNDWDWDVWLKGTEVAQYLDYRNPNDVIIEHVEPQNKLTYEELSNILTIDPSEGKKNIDKKTKFINLAGFFNLIHGSTKPIAKKIKSWLDNEVLPSLVKRGEYSMIPKIRLPKFYEEHSISEYFSKSCMYIGYIGAYKLLIDGEYKWYHLFKYGLSRKMFERDYKQHRKTYNKFEIVYISEADNAEMIEELFEADLKIRNIHKEMVVGGKNRTELFYVNDTYAIESMIAHMDNLIKNNPSPKIKEKNMQLNEKDKIINTYERNDEIKKLELKWKLSENYKLKQQVKIKEQEVQIKKIEAETKIKLRELEVQLELAKLGDVNINLPLAITQANPKKVTIKKITRKRNDNIIEL